MIVTRAVTLICSFVGLLTLQSVLSLRFHGKQFGERKTQIWTNVFIVVDDCPSSGDNCENQFDNRDNPRLTAIFAKDIITPMRRTRQFLKRFGFCQ